MTRRSIIILAVVAIIGIQIAMGFAAYMLLPDWVTRGQFGDMFGVVNTLFSGLAFAGVIYAILLQREDLTLQREELKLTRAELRRSAEAQEKSERALSVQAVASAQSARLSAINYLLDHYQSELAKLRINAYPQGDPRLARIEALEQKRTLLLGLLDEVFDSTTHRHD